MLRVITNRWRCAARGPPSWEWRPCTTIGRVIERALEKFLISLDLHALAVWAGRVSEHAVRGDDGIGLNRRSDLAWDDQGQVATPR